MRNKIARCFHITVYWALVILCLFSASPVFFDGAGPTPSFFWGRLPAPTLGEYYQRKLYYDSIFLLPYLAAGVVVTVIGYVIVPLLLKRIRLFPNRPFLGASCLTLLLLLLIAAFSDIGGMAGLWQAPAFILHTHYHLSIIPPLSKVFIPASLLSGALEAGRWKNSGNSKITL
jgi:hypothetical protein